MGSLIDIVDRLLGFVGDVWPNNILLPGAPILLERTRSLKPEVLSNSQWR